MSKNRAAIVVALVFAILLIQIELDEAKKGGKNKCKKSKPPVAN